MAASPARESPGASPPWLFWAGVLVLAAVALATLAGFEPPAPLPSGPQEDAFSAGRAAALLRHLYEGLPPHPVGSEKNRDLRLGIEARFRDMGYEPQVQRRLVCRSPRAVCAPVENILVRIEGEPGRKAVLVSSHYDSVPAGPSVSDAGVSVAAILEIARAVRAEAPFPNPVIFLINDGEEAGLLGARAFVEGHPWSREVGAVINLEARGTSGRSWMFETSAGGGWLVEAYAGSVPHPATASVAYAIYKRLPTDTDLTVYKAAGLQGLGLAFIGRIQHYHTSADDLSNLDERSLQHQGESALALLRRLAAMDIESPAPWEAVFFDLFGAVTVWWPASWSLPLALVSAALAAGAFLALARVGVISARGVAIGLGVWSVSLGAALGAGLAVALLLDQIGAFRSQYPAHAWAPVGAAGAAGAAAACLVAAALRRRAGLWEVQMGGTIAWAVLGIALTLGDPALSYLALLPAVSLSVAALIAAATSRSAVRSAAFVASMAPGAIVWLQILFVIFGAMGEVVLPAVSVLSAMVISLAAPALAGIARRTSWIPGALAAACAIVLSVAAVLAPGATESLPERLSLGYHVDPEGGVARWVLYGKAPLPLRLVEVVGGPIRRDRAFPWWDSDELLAPAPVVAAAAPVAIAARPLDAGEGSSEAPGTAGQHEERPRTGPSPGAPRWLHLESRRGAGHLELVLPAPGRVERVRYPEWGDSEVGEGIRYGDWRGFRFLGVPPEGIDLEISLEGDAAAGGWLMDRTAGLPPEGLSLIAARPAWAVASQAGDSTVVYRRIEIPPPASSYAAGGSGAPR